jgi:hypothetical protein
LLFSALGYDIECHTDGKTISFIFLDAYRFSQMMGLMNMLSLQMRYRKRAENDKEMHG